MTTKKMKSVRAWALMWKGHIVLNNDDSMVIYNKEYPSSSHAIYQGFGLTEVEIRLIHPSRKKTWNWFTDEFQDGTKHYFGAPIFGHILMLAIPILGGILFFLAKEVLPGHWP